MRRFINTLIWAARGLLRRQGTSTEHIQSDLGGASNEVCRKKNRCIRWRIYEMAHAIWRFMKKKVLVLFLFSAILTSCSLTAGDRLRISVYATAGNVLHYFASSSEREMVVENLKRLQVSRVFLEGRRGDEYVPPTTLREASEFLKEHGIETTGGIATVPGSQFGVRQNEGLGWLNWEHPKTRKDIMTFFSENAPIFEEIIVDDFYCTGDTSVDSVRAKGDRSWAEYRADLLVTSIQPLIIEPARRQNPGINLIIKYPQWYDRFQLFGYAPHRMSPYFNKVWVGTEVRNPQTQRMGFVQPTEGFMNYRWISSIAGSKVEGAWFDHIECSAQNFIDQAYQSVLAGAKELTLFHLGDIMEGHPGDSLLAQKLPELFRLAELIAAQKSRDGIAYYKPPGSEAADNLYLMDYLGMIGFPILPESSFPERTVVFLGAQAAADNQIMAKVRNHLSRGGYLIMTPAFLRQAGGDASKLAGVESGQITKPDVASSIKIESNIIALGKPLELDSSVIASSAKVLQYAQTQTKLLPFFTYKSADQGMIFVLNVRTFEEQDFRVVGEWLLCPRTRGITELPQPVMDNLRQALFKPLNIRFEAPSGVGIYLFGKAYCLYNFQDNSISVTLDAHKMELKPHSMHWQVR